MKLLLRMVAVALAVCLMLTGTAIAEDPQIKVLVNGTPVIFPDQQPVIIDGRTLVPLRAVFEHMGAKVSWIELMQSAIIETDSAKVSLIIGSKNAVVNSVVVKLDVPPKLINGRTMVPLRFISENLGFEVGWEEETSTINIKGEVRMSNKIGLTKESVVAALTKVNDY